MKGRTKSEEFSRACYVLATRDVIQFTVLAFTLKHSQETVNQGQPQQLRSRFANLDLETAKGGLAKALRESGIKGQQRSTIDATLALARRPGIQSLSENKIEL